MLPDILKNILLVGSGKIPYFTCNERCQQGIPVGNTSDQSCRMPSDWAFMGNIQPHIQRRKQLVRLHHSRSLRRLHDILDILERSSHHAAVRQPFRLRHIHMHQCNSRNCPCGIRICPDEIGPSPLLFRKRRFRVQYVQRVLRYLEGSTTVAGNRIYIHNRASDVAKPQ